MRTGKLNVEGLLSNERLNVIENNIMTLAFYRSVDNAKSLYSLDNGFIDQYEDETGIDSLNSENNSYDATDDYYYPGNQGVDANTKLLIHGDFNDGAGGIFDDSGHDHPIVGITGGALDNSVKKFGRTSLNFNGTGDYVDIPDSPDWDFGTGDFTIDFWIYFASTGNYEEIIDIQNGNSNGIRFTKHDSDRVDVYINGTLKSFAWSCSATTWYHFALVRSSGNLYMFVDGTQIGSTLTSTENISGGTNGIKLGRNWGAFAYLAGKMDELRISGNARWTTGFSVPTSAYTTDANTLLLLHMDTADESPEAHQVLFYGDAEIRAPRFGDGCGNFDGTTSYLSIDDHADWDLAGSSSDNWTVDLFVKFDGSNYGAILIQQYEDTDNRWEISNALSGGYTYLYFRVISGGSAVVYLDNYQASVNTGITDTDWHHVSLCKVADEYGLYLDGIQIAYVQDSSTDTFSGPLNIGRNGGDSAYFAGMMDEIRIVKSNAFSASPNSGKTDTITVPWAEHVSDSNTHLLLHLNLDFEDSGNTGHTVKTHWVDFLFNQSSKIGTGCCYFDGGDSLSIPDSSDWDICASTSESWTIGFWTKLDAFSGYPICHYQDGNNKWDIRYISGSGFTFRVKDTNVYTIDMGATGAGELTDTDWHYVALVKINNEYGLYVDGVQVKYLQSNTTASFTGSLYIGGNPDVNNITGYLDEVLISKSNVFSASPNSGLTDTITVPTSEYTSDTNTKLLLHLDSDFSDSGDTGHTVTSNGGTLVLNKFGTANLYFPSTGTTTSIAMSDSNDWDFIGNNTDSYTIEFWIKFDGTPGSHSPMIQWNGSSTNDSNWLRYEHSPSLGWGFQCRQSASTILATGWGGYTTDNHWHHIALVIVGNGSTKNVGIYKDGIQVAYTQDDSTQTLSYPLRFGGSGVTATAINGWMDEIRIQKSNVFSASPNSGLTDTITVPTAVYSSDPSNMTLQSIAGSAESSPETARLVVYEEDVDAVTLNTDLIAKVSLDNGSTWADATLQDDGNYEGNKRILSSDLIDMTQSGIGTGTQIKYKLQTANNKDLKIHGVGVNWL